jgi:hypothetical protein
MRKAHDKRIKQRRNVMPNRDGAGPLTGGGKIMGRGLGICSSNPGKTLLLTLAGITLPIITRKVLPNLVLNIGRFIENRKNKINRIP